MNCLSSKLELNWLGYGRRRAVLWSNTSGRQLTTQDHQWECISGARVRGVYDGLWSSTCSTHPHASTPPQRAPLMPCSPKCTYVNHRRMHDRARAMRGQSSTYTRQRGRAFYLISRPPMKEGCELARARRGGVTADRGWNIKNFIRRRIRLVEGSA